MSSRLFLALAIAAVSAAVVAGLLIVGGPLQGQRDRFDNLRYQELDKLARALLCERAPGPYGFSLPDELTVESLRAHCSSAGITADDLTDDESGVPYSYERTSDRDFLICAVFHDTARTARLNDAMPVAGSFDAGTGCLSGRVR